jgi:hypothetical protein
MKRELQRIADNMEAINLNFFAFKNKVYGTIQLDPEVRKALYHLDRIIERRIRDTSDNTMTLLLVNGIALPKRKARL